MLSRLQAISTHLRGAASTGARAMASQTVYNDNVACCTVPPVQSDYDPKGSVKPWAGFKSVYMTGPERSATALVCVFDIFGIKPQTQQGADLLAAALDARVVMPDFFEPHAPWDDSRFPPKTPADRAALQAFFGGPANPQKNVEKLHAVGTELRKEGAQRVGAYGLCWGGKVTILEGSKSDTPLDAVGVIHPAMLKAEDTVALDVPLAIYVSPDEPAGEYTKIVNIMSAKPTADKLDYALYSDMFHGWAGARADLEDPENKKQFQDVYGRLAKYFKAAFE